MRVSIVWTILRREWLEILRNRLLMSTILVPPVLLTIAPIILAGALGNRALPPELAAEVLAQRPEWASFTEAAGLAELIVVDRLHPSLVASLNGDRFISDPETLLGDDDRVLILSADAGG